MTSNKIVRERVVSIYKWRRYVLAGYSRRTLLRCWHSIKVLRRT